MRVENEEQYQVAKSLLNDPKFAETHPEEANELLGLAEQYSHKVDVQEFQSMQDFTPVEYTAPVVSGSARGAHLASTQGRKEHVVEARENIAKSAASGVDVNTGMNFSDRQLAGLLAFAPKAQHAAYEHLAAKELKEAGYRIPDGQPLVARDELTGKTSFLRGYTDEEGNKKLKWTFVNPAGADLGDAGRVALETVQGLPEQAAGVVGAAAGGGTLGTVGALAGPGAAAVGASTGATVGYGLGTGVANNAANKLRRAVASKFLPEEVMQHATNESMRDEAYLAGGMAFAIPVLGGATRMWRNQGRVFDANTSDEFMREMTDNVTEVAEKIARIEEKTGQKYTLTAAAATGDPQLAVAQAAASRRVIGKESEKLAVDKLKNDAASVNAIKASTDHVVPRNPDLLSVDEAAEKAQGIVKAGAKTRDDFVASAEDTLEQASKKLNDVWDEKAYLTARERAEETYEAARELNTVSWDGFRKSTERGMHPSGSKSATNIQLDNPPGSPLRTVAEEIADDSKLALSESLSKAQKGFLDDLGYEVGEQGDVVFSRLMDETLDTHQLHKLLSHLKKEQRDIANGSSTLGWKGDDISNVIGAIHEQMDMGTFRRISSGRQVNPGRATQIRDSFYAANKATTDLAERQMGDAHKLLLDTDLSGRFKAPPSVIHKTFFTPMDERTMQDGLRATDNDVGVRFLMADELGALYKRKVLRQGATPEAHNEFMNNFRGHMKTLGMNEDNISSYGDMISDIKRLKKVAERKQRHIEAMYGKRLTQEATYAGNVATDMMSDKVPVKNIVNLRRRLGGKSDEWKSIQRAGLEELENKFLKNADTLGNSDAISDLLTKQEPRLVAMYGKDYVQNLKDIRDVMNIMAGTDKAGNIRREIQPGWLQMTRTFFGPLSKSQRRFSAANNFFRRRGDRLMGELLANPDRLMEMRKIAGFADQGWREQVKQGALGSELSKHYSQMEQLGLTDAMADEEMAKLMYTPLEGKGTPPAERAQSANEVRKGKTIQTYVPGIGAPPEVLEKFARGG